MYHKINMVSNALPYIRQEVKPHLLKKDEREHANIGKQKNSWGLRPLYFFLSNFLKKITALLWRLIIA